MNFLINQQKKVNNLTYQENKVNIMINPKN